MEENKTASTKLSYEELEKVAIQLQQRLQTAEARLSSISNTAIRIDYLFKVLDKASSFEHEVVSTAANEIAIILGLNNHGENEVESDKATE